MSRITLEHGVRGGMEQYGHVLASSLCAVGHDVVVITTAQPAGAPVPAGETAPYRTVFVPNTIPGQNSAAWWTGSASAFDDLDRDDPFDVVVSQQSGALGWVRNFRRRYVPLVVVAHGSVLDALANEMRRARSVRHVARYVRHVPQRLWTLASMDRVYMGRADRVIAVAPHIADVVRRARLVAPHRLEVIPLGIDLDLFTPSVALRETKRRALGFVADDPVILSVGRLQRSKGVHVLLEALATTPGLVRVRAVIVGDGPERASLEAQSRASGLQDRVTFVGSVHRQETPPYYNAADIFTLLTLDVDTSPTAMIEAMACGLPTVASNLDGPRTLLGNPPAGRLVKPGDASALARALQDLLHAPGEARRLGAAAKARVASSYSLDTMVARTAAVLVDVIGDSRERHVMTEARVQP